MEELLQTAREYGAMVGKARRDGDQRMASYHWNEYACWYKALLDGGGMSVTQFDAIDAAYKEAEQDEALTNALDL